MAGYGIVILLYAGYDLSLSFPICFFISWGINTGYGSL